MPWSQQFTYRLLHPLWVDDAKRKTALLKPLIDQSSHLLEIGSGPGTLLQQLIVAGYQTTPLDLNNQIIVPDLPEPVLYDGSTMPFADDEFDLSLLFCVLHHCQDPVAVFREAGRVGKRIAIVEDVFRSRAQLALTQLTDSLVNAEFVGHPHQQKSEQQWEKLFEVEGWQIQHSQSWRLFGLYRQAFYLLSPTAS